MTLDLATRRTRFELDLPPLSRCVFLNTADQGPKLACVHNRVQELENDVFYNSPSLVEVYERLHTAVEESRTALSGFFNAHLDETVFVRGIAEALNMLLPHFELGPGDEVITSDQENPAVLLPLLHGAESRGYTVRYLEVGGSCQNMLDRMEALCCARTRLVAMSHVSHMTGYTLPVRELTAIAQQRGAFVVWDGAQSAGQIPVDFAGLGCDAYLAAGYKWMLGLHGTSVMLLQRRHVEAIRPVFVGVGSENRFDFADNSYTLKSNGRKFEYGSRHLPPFAALGLAARYLADLDMHAVETRSRALALRVLSSCADIPGFVPLSPASEEAASGIAAFTFADFDAEDFVLHAWKTERIVIKTRFLSPFMPNVKGIRVSCHFFNQEHEVDLLAACLREYRTRLV